MSSSSKIFLNPLLNPITNLPDRNPKIRTFHKSLPAYAQTPLLSLPTLASSLGIKYLLLKDETQRLGLTAFKILGASWATYCALTSKLSLSPELEEEDGVVPMKRLGEEARKEGIVLYAATDGNHGRAVARMGKYLGIKARIYVPGMLDEEAKAKIRGEGAEVVIHEGDYDQTVIVTKEAAEKHDGGGGKGVLVSDTALGLDDESAKWMVEGYQTMFDEIEEQVLEVTGTSTITHVVTPVGVGSLAQAVVTHFQRTERLVKPTIIAVEPNSAACLKTSLEAGEMTSVSAEYTICTGMCCGTLSAIGWPILKNGIGASVALDDSDVDTAVKKLLSCGVNAGPCGAAALAGLEYLSTGRDLAFGPEAVVVLLCTEGTRGYEFKNQDLTGVDQAEL